MLGCCTLNQAHGPLTIYVELRVAHAPGMPGKFSLPLRVSDPDMHHGTCMTHVPWCMPGSLTSGFLWNRWRGKRFWHSRRMRNPQFYVSGKRPMHSTMHEIQPWTLRAKYQLGLRSYGLEVDTANQLFGMLNDAGKICPGSQRLITISLVITIWSAGTKWSLKVMFIRPCPKGFPTYSGGWPHRCRNIALSAQQIAKCQPFWTNWGTVMDILILHKSAFIVPTTATWWRNIAPSMNSALISNISSFALQNKKKRD